MAYSSERFANKYEAALNSIASLYSRSIESGASTNDILIAIGNIDFKDLFENQLGFNT